MTRRLPALHEGHAPIELHEAFAHALEAFEHWDRRTAEPRVRFDGRDVPISSVFGRMRTCFDILPLRLREAVADVVGGGAAAVAEDGRATFADAAVHLRAMCLRRLRRAVA
ncbi:MULTISPECIES: hypothetical protein [Chelatococcus]|uniref:Uncharacterized protein n=1 Tax=Chelatococcus caeni TaxID=1348468 RepID=A0A840BWL8_9HYPH|nr:MULTISPECIES: hypothetical protein [Chelatococcus]ALA18606.1 hypothetical protein AL346_15830 [Chelatococcus sp. CO-6]MBB4015739.1 hypothetical protein [Chelatococcus caeni]